MRLCLLRSPLPLPLWGACALASEPGPWPPRARGRGGSGGVGARGAPAPGVVGARAFGAGRRSPVGSLDPDLVRAGAPATVHCPPPPPRGLLGGRPQTRWPASAASMKSLVPYINLN
jgi:hypothetical protein